MNPSAEPTKECDIRVKKDWPPRWIFLKYQKQLLFTGNHETSGVITCRPLPSKTETLPEMGILELSSGCILQTKSVVLHGQSKVIGNTRINFKIFSKLNIEKLDPIKHEAIRNCRT